MRAMLDGLETVLGNAGFTLIVQFQDTSLEIPFKEDVTTLHMKMPYSHFLGLVLYSGFRLSGLRFPFLLTANTRRIVLAYEHADIVISAPGGPYFGDIYYKHEIVHWFYVWLACLYKKPLFLYAPSAGPFNKRLLNIVRKYLFRKFDVLCVREEISRDHLVNLLGKDTKIHVTADSAIQQSIEPCPRDEYFTGDRSGLADKYLVAVSAIQYRFPGADDPETQQARYTEILLQCLHHLAGKRDCHFLFIPQLYGRMHSDVPYLEYLAGQLPGHASRELVNPGYDSTMQRRLFGMADLCIASRYHPQIFAATAGVPGVCIYYEHKAQGFMSFLGMEDFAFDIRNLDAALMCAKLDEVIEDHDRLSALLDSRIGPVQERSRKTSLLAAGLCKESQGHIAE